MTPIIQTNRLFLREFSPEIDTEPFYNLNSDWEVMKYTGDVAFNSQEEAKTFLENYSDYDRNGYGRWTVCLKENNEVVGWCGLKKHDNGMVDLGYRFFKKNWGKGYATEASKACLEYGFNELQIEEIVGRTARENKGSIRVLEKVGMTFWKEDTCEGIEDSIYYRIEIG